MKHHPDRPSKSVELVGIAGTGHWVAAARALAHEVIDRSTIDPSGFRFVQLKDYRSSDFLHGAVKYGDLPAMLALGTPSALNLVVDHKEDGDGQRSSCIGWLSRTIPSDKVRRTDKSHPSSLNQKVLRSGMPDHFWNRVDCSSPRGSASFDKPMLSIEFIQ